MKGGKGLVTRNTEILLMSFKASVVAIKGIASSLAVKKGVGRCGPSEAVVKGAGLNSIHSHVRPENVLLYNNERHSLLSGRLIPK